MLIQLETLLDVTGLDVVGTRCEARAVQILGAECGPHMLEGDRPSSVPPASR